MASDSQTPPALRDGLVGLRNAFVRWFALTLCRFVLLPIFSRISVTGLENVPPRGAIILVANHLSDSDPGILMTRVRRKVLYMAKVELFKVQGFRQFMEAFGFPVQRNAADLRALRNAQAVLDAGVALGMFPEGTGSGLDARMQKAWPGAALIALRSGAPIVPAGITGTQRMNLPRLFAHPFRINHVNIVIGEPFHLEVPPRINNAAAQAGTDAIMLRIAALLPESYRGYYGSAFNASVLSTSEE
jgi:1-acyl-sn-glycerol-3-phosphate acyltransferase